MRVNGCERRTLQGTRAVVAAAQLGLEAGLRSLTAPVPLAVLPPPLLSALNFNFSRADSRSGRSGSAAGGAPERAWRAERAGDAGLALQLGLRHRGADERLTHCPRARVYGLFLTFLSIVFL